MDLHLVLPLVMCGNKLAALKSLTIIVNNCYVDIQANSWVFHASCHASSF